MNNNVMMEIEKIKTIQADFEVRIIRRIEIGNAVQQGDLYIFRVADNHPHGNAIGENSVQVALGTGNGARHMAVGSVQVFQGKKLPESVKIADVSSKTIMGPCIVASDTWTLTHPEHAHHQLPRGTYQVTYQYDPRTMRRVAD